MKNLVIQSWPVQSASNPTKSYKVSLHVEGNFGCECPAWRFQKGGQRTECKHIAIVKQSSPLAAAFQIARTAISENMADEVFEHVLINQPEIGAELPLAARKMWA